MSADGIAAPAWLGVVGGGQLGQMFTRAAKKAGYQVAVYTHADYSPAAQVADRITVGAYDDTEMIGEFAKSVAALTFEFENVSAAAAYKAAEYTVVRPQPRVLEIAQERFREKEFLRSHAIGTAPYRLVRSEGELADAISDIGPDVVFKTAVSGYDGHGQVRITKRKGIERAQELLADGPGVVEGWIDFRCELSVIVARNPQGRTTTYGPFLNDHADHILDVSVTPSGLESSLEHRAVLLATGVAKALDLEGLLCVEMFLTRDGQLLVNEVAPRPHNSGHLTIEAFESSQFDQQVRTLCGLELGGTGRTAPAAAMANLLGDLWFEGQPDPSVAKEEFTFVHVYGKAEPRRRRKMGHVTTLAATAEEARQRALAVRKAFAGHPQNVPVEA